MVLSHKILSDTDYHDTFWWLVFDNVMQKLTNLFATVPFHIHEK